MSSDVFEALIARWFITVAGIYIIRLFFRQSVRIIGLAPIIMVALVIAPVNVFIAEIAGLLGFPQTPEVLFALCIVFNGLMFHISSYFIPDFFIENLPIALTFSVILSVFTMFILYVFRTQGMTVLF